MNPPASIKAPNHLRLGEYHPAFGGHFAGMVRGEADQPDYYLFVAPKEAGEAVKAWGGHGVAEPNAEHSHDGAANTAALVASTTEHPAAQFCAGLKLDGFNDWYLPSREELRVAYTNCKALFDPAWYWSSTQYAGNSNNAWSQDLVGGYQGLSDKKYEGRCRAVRRLLVI